MKQKYTWELRSIDAWGNKKEGYEYNETFHVKDISCVSGRERHYLLDLILPGYRRAYKVVYDGDCYELQYRKTDEPLFILIPIER
jgi:hypothetical protein